MGVQEVGVMPDLLAHALLAYAIATALSFRFDWLTSPYVTVVMIGSFIPDLTKVGLIIPSQFVEQLLGTPFS
jgi:hypothetical protein